MLSLFIQQSSAAAWLDGVFWPSGRCFDRNLVDTSCWISCCFKKGNLKPLHWLLQGATTLWKTMFLFLSFFIKLTASLLTLWNYIWHVAPEKKQRWRLHPTTVSVTSIQNRLQWKSKPHRLSEYIGCHSVCIYFHDCFQQIWSPESLFEQVLTGMISLCILKQEWRRYLNLHIRKHSFVDFLGWISIPRS